MKREEFGGTGGVYLEVGGSMRLEIASAFLECFLEYIAHTTDTSICVSSNSIDKNKIGVNLH